jgi:hypothetical protein
MKVQALAFALSIALLACGTDSTTDMVFDPPDDSGAADNPLDEETPPVTFSFVQENILNRSCALSGCHADATFPNLSADRAYDNIVNALSSSNASIDLIEPGDPANSYLFIKITNGEGIQGSRMPRGGPALSEDLIAAVKEWIERGAPND